MSAPGTILSKLAWRMAYLARDGYPFPLSVRMRRVTPFLRPPSQDDMLMMSLRRDGQGHEYFALGGQKLYFRPEFAVDDQESFLWATRLLLRETFFKEEFFNDHVSLRAGDVVLDLGANIGTTVIDFARRVGPAGRVYAFEPVVHETMERNLRANGVANAEVLAQAVAEHPGTMEIAISDFVIDSSVASTPGDYGRLPSRKQTVPVTTIDQFVADRGLDRVDLVKMDIEGAEELALRGALDTVSRCRPKWTIASYHTDHQGDAQHPKLVRLLRDLGYQVEERGTERIYAW